jgi:tetratricopeptide (TPR) repeat protein
VASDFAELLHAELAKLPAGYRAAVLLCDLEGQTLAEAAKQLGVPAGTVASRLARGRSKLAARLSKLGLSVSAGLISTLLAESAKAAAVSFDPTAAAPVSVSTLADEVIRTMFTVPKLTRLGVLLVAAAAVGIAWGQVPTPPKAEPPKPAPADSGVSVVDILKQARREADEIGANDQRVYCLVAVGAEFARHGDKKEAAKHFRAAVDYLPEKDRATTVGWMARMALGAGLDVPAEVLDAAKEGDDSGERAEWYFRTGKVKELRALADRTTLEKKDFALQALAQEHLFLGNLADAEKAIGEIASTSVTTEATRVHLLAQLAFAQHKAKDKDAAAKTLEATRGAILRLTGKLPGGSGLLDDAHADLAGALAATGNSVAARDALVGVRTAKVRDRVLAMIARHEFENGDAKAAEKTLEDVSGDHQADRVRWRMATHLVAKKEWKQAEAVAAKMTCVYWQVRLQFDLAAGYHTLGMTAEAEKALAKGKELAGPGGENIKDREPGYAGLRLHASMFEFEVRGRVGDTKGAMADAGKLDTPANRAYALLSIARGLRAKQPGEDE